MRAVKLARSHFNIPAKSHVLVASDNSTVVAYINKVGGTRSWSLRKETFFSLVITLKICIRVRFIPGRMNVIADDLSRGGQILPTEWSLHQDLVNFIFQQWGHPSLDLFATRFNKKCATFVSVTTDHRAVFTDALAMSWEGIFAYAFPPQQILHQVIQKFDKTSHCLLILVAPFWPKQMWFADLQRLSGKKPILCQRLRSMPANGKSLNLGAFPKI